MGNIKCLNCRNEISMISGMACPNCGARLSHVLISFLTYLGPEDSLNGYQRSYKLVFLKSLFTEIKYMRKATVAAVTEGFRNYYQERKHYGLIPDQDVDNRIANVEKSDLRDIWLLIQMNPYAAISKKGFIKVKGDGLNGTFVLQKGLDELSAKEIDSLLDLLDRKLELYYRKIDSTTVAWMMKPPVKVQKATDEETLEAVQKLLENYSPPKTAVKKESQPVSPIKKPQGEKHIPLPAGADENTPLEDIPLSNRAYNALRRHGVDTLGQMRAEFESGSIAEIKNIGRTVITEIGTLLSVPMQNTDLPMEPKQELPENIFDGVFADTLGEEAPNVTIDDIFPEGVFNLFRAFCSKRSIQYASDLIGLHYEELVKEKGFGKTKIAKIIERWETARNYIPAKTITKSFEEQLTEQLDDIARDRNFDILIKRISGRTLQETADEYGLTRERVRQICVKIERKIYIQIRQLASILLNQNNGGYFREEQLREYIDNEIYQKAIVHTLREAKEYFSFGSPAVFLDANSFPKAESDLAELAESIVGDGINIFESEDAIDAAFEEAGYGFLGAEDLLELLIKYEYVFYGDYVVKNAKSYAKLCAQIVEDEFPEGITNSDEDLNRLRALAKERYGDLDIPASNRSFFTRITVHLVLRGRSQYIAPRYIYADESIIAEIKAYIDASKQRDLFYSEIFAEHEGLLLMMTNIDNPWFLHGVLTYFYPHEYTYSRDFLSKDSGEQTLDLGERVSIFLKQAGRAMTRKELLQNFPGISDVMLFNAVGHTAGLIQWDYNYYNSIDNVRLVGAELEQLRDFIETITQANDGYCSEGMLFKAVSESMPAFLERNGGMNSQNVFYTCAELLGQCFEFKRPHIACHGRFKSLHVIEIARDMLGDCNHIKASDYFRITKKLMWPEVTASMAFGEMEKDYIRLNLDEYVHKSCFEIGESDLQFAKALIADSAGQNWFLPLQNFMDSEEELPCGMSVNEFFMGALVAEYSLGWHIVSPQMKDRRYQRGILVRNDVPVYAYDELISKVLKEQGIKTISEEDLQGFLQIHSLVYNYLPKELQKSARFKYSDGMFEVL